MNSLDQDVLDAVRRWAKQGYRFALVTVARTWGSAPRPAGAWLALREDGLVQGSVSGGCIEDDLIRRARAGEFWPGQAFHLEYGVTREEALRSGPPCGGRIILVVEPEPDLEHLYEMERMVGQGRLARRSLDLTSGSVTLSEGHARGLADWDGRRLTTQHGPQWRLFIVGAGQFSYYLATMAQALGYAVTVCGPRKEYHSEWDVPGAPWLPGFPDDIIMDMNPDPHTAIVALTHDPKLDDMALLEALKSPAFYAGALGSRANNARRRERLLEHFDLTAEQVNRFRGPVGLAIGSRTPPENSVSILAEMTAMNRGCAVGQGSSAGARVDHSESVCGTASEALAR